MSDPSETSGRLLASNPQQSSEGTTPPTSFHRKRRRTSQSSDERVGGTKSSRRRPGTRKEAFGPHTGSSRGESSTMQRSISPAQTHQDVPVNYTRTGRISKAKKGLKVHNCECGRSYTRAEHLRRHQKNHNQDALICEVPECGKTFFRLDLLQRHQERHNEVGIGNERRPSIYSQGSAAEPEASANAPVSISTDIMASVTRALDPPQYYPPTSMSPMPSEPTSDPRYRAAQFRIPKLPSSAFGNLLRPSPTFNLSKQQQPFRSVRQPEVAIPISGEGYNTIYPEPWSPPNYSSSSSYASPGPNDFSNVFASHTFGPSSNRTRASSIASFNEPWASYPSRSPTSATSTMPFSWAATDKSPAAHQLPLSLSMSSSPYGMSIPLSAPADAMPGYIMFPGPKTMAQRDEEEQAFLFPEQSFGMDTTIYQFDQYLDNYWRLFHPSFPVIHRATLGGVNDSPMLKAAMIAIGAQYSNDPSARKRSRTLYDRCMKLLDQRDTEVISEPPRLCDCQSVFLLEVIAQYRGRRAAQKLSGRFEDMYRSFAQDNRIMNPATVENLATISTSTPESSPYDRWCQWIRVSSRQRLLLSCYLLETQQATLLARTPQPSIIQTPGFDLPYPASCALWDAATPAEWAISLPQYVQSPSYIYEVFPDYAVNSSLPPLDVFQSSLLIATHYHHFNNATPYLTAPVQSIDHLLDGSSLTKYHLLTAQVIRNTPIRALLAVSGESWILSEKVPSIAAFAGFKATLRTWVNDLWAPETEARTKPVKDALKASIDLLLHTMTTQSQSLRMELGADMGIYYAALVIWATTVAANSRLNPIHSPTQALQYPRHRSPIQKHRSTTSQHSAYSGTPGSLQQSAYTSPPMGAPQQSQTPNPVHPASIGLMPSALTSSIAPASSNSMLHSEISVTSLSFLNLAAVEIELLGIVAQWPKDVAQWQQGSGALLRWVKMKLRNGALEGRDSVISSGPTSISMGRGVDNFEELLDGIISVLEKVMGRGWEGWGV